MGGSSPLSMSTRETEPWEQVLYDIVKQHNEQPNHRIIHWFYDHIGESGKTVNAKQLVFEHNSFYTTGGKANDIYHAYNREPIAVLNICASQNKECIDHLYKILEEFKDGIFTSGKYGSTTKIFKSPLVIVFSNELPDETKMKKNRLQIHNIQELNNTSMAQDTIAPIFKKLNAPHPAKPSTNTKKRKIDDLPDEQLEILKKRVATIQLKRYIGGVTRGVKLTDIRYISLSQACLFV